jgi:Holliday junction resolvase RusA-like endonuclease
VPTARLEWDDCPPSMNAKASGYGANHHVASRTKRTWEGVMMAMLLKAKLPKDLAWVRVNMELRFPDKRRRDEGNFRMVVEKALGDVMQRMGYISDDTPDIYRFGSVTFDPEKGPKRMILTLDYELEND